MENVSDLRTCNSTKDVAINVEPPNYMVSRLTRTGHRTYVERGGLSSLTYVHSRAVRVLPRL